jgi:undecaprenyl-diphosphatase
MDAQTQYMSIFFPSADLELAQNLKGFHPPYLLDLFLRMATHLGDSRFLLILISLISLGLWRICSRNIALAFCICAVSSAMACEGIKYLVQRPRPDMSLSRVEKLPSSPSFPSGHTMVSTTVFGSLAVLCTFLTQRKTIRLILNAVGIFIPILVGLTRMYLGVHYLSDVLGGWVGGGIFVFVLHLWIRKNSNKPTDSYPPSLEG